MIDNNLYYEYQCGFLPSHSTVHQLLEIYHRICLSLDKNKHTCLVFCDISKAFDHVWHRGLVAKLKSFYGFGGNLILWVTDYISHRTQSVVIQNSKIS